MMFICFGENSNVSMGVGKGETAQAAISNWCRLSNTLVYMREYQAWKPTIIEGEEIQIDFEINIQIIKPE